VESKRSRVHLSLLDKSNPVIRYSTKKKKEFELEIFNGFSEEEANALSLLIDKVSNNIGKKDN
jgi:DNA-binding MarR family transcriptional regulator